MEKYLIVGFDGRKQPLLCLQDVNRLDNYNPSDDNVFPPYPATFSEHIWPRTDALSANEAILNSHGIMFLPDAKFVDPSCLSVAFLVAESQVLEYSDKSQILREDVLMPECGWKFAGYDVVDLKLGFSGFYGFTWKPGELSSLFAGEEIEFNNIGLLLEKKAAEVAAQRFNAVIPEHAPFSLIKVFIQLR